MAWNRRCDLEHRRGCIEQAVLAGHAAVKQVERIRGTFQADRFRTAFLGHRATIYEGLVAALLELFFPNRVGGGLG